MTPHYFNEFDPKAAAWLRELMADGLIPKGVVDERDIREVQPADLAGYGVVHLFAGIGGWAEALQLAGWDDSRPVWTASCPCPPFSAAGKKKRCPECGSRPVPCPRRTGFFICTNEPCSHAWHADERHLWPEVWRLVRDCRPATIFGEQVSGPDGLVWLAGVRGSLEVLGYGVGGADLCGPCVGSPDIRQRLFWVADAGHGEQRRAGEFRPVGAGAGERDEEGVDDQRSGAVGGLAHAEHGRPAEQEPRAEPRPPVGGMAGGLADTDGGKPRNRRVQRGRKHGQRAENGGTVERVAHADSEAGTPGERDELRERRGGTREPGDEFTCGLGDASGAGQQGRCLSDGERPGECVTRQAGGETGFAASDFWSDYLVIRCGDGKFRRIPAEPLLFPLATGIPGRVGLLRGAGNAIKPEVGAEFVTAFLESETRP